MESVKNQITDFLDKCDEVRNCKFIMATTKIKDLLKSIVNSEELYGVFNTVASKFDYIAAKERCFVESDDLSDGRSRVILPDTVGERLAFIFCLLVEIDRGDIQINAFLQKFYPKDGSYYASYHMFCDEVIGSLESAICDIFAQDLAEDDKISGGETRGRIASKSADSSQTSVINTISMLIASELDYVAASSLSEDDKEAAASILTQLERAVRDFDEDAIDALTYGYNYFVMFTRTVSESLNNLFDIIGEFVNYL